MTESGTITEPDSSSTDTTALEFGEALRNIRQGHNLNLSDAAKTLRIRETYLEAIEGGQFKNLPGPAYANGFVRAYANYLGLEIDEVMRRYHSATSSTPSQPSLAPLSPTAEARLPTGFVLLVAAVLAAGTYGIWYYLMVHGQGPIEVISTLPKTMSDSDSVGLTKKTNQKFETSVQRLSSEKAEKLKNQLSVAKEVSSPNPAINPEKITTAIVPKKAHRTPQIKAKDPILKKLEVKRLGAKTQSQNVPPKKKVISKLLKPESRIVLRANAASWVELRGPGGKRLISRILREGDSYQVPVQAGIKFTTGNAGGIDVLVDGKIIASLGPVGAVRRDILLDPDTLLARSPGQR